MGLSGLPATRNGLQQNLFPGDKLLEDESNDMLDWYKPLAVILTPLSKTEVIQNLAEKLSSSSYNRALPYHGGRCVCIKPQLYFSF